MNAHPVESEALLTPVRGRDSVPGGPEDRHPVGQGREAVVDPHPGWSPPLPRVRGARPAQRCSAAAPVGRLSDRYTPGRARRPRSTGPWPSSARHASGSHQTAARAVFTELRGSRRRDPRSSRPVRSRPATRRQPLRRAATTSASRAATPATAPPITASAFLRASGARVAARRVAPQADDRRDRPPGLRARVEARHQLVHGRRQLGAGHGELGLQRHHLRRAERLLRACGLLDRLVAHALNPVLTASMSCWTFSIAFAGVGGGPGLHAVDADEHQDHDRPAAGTRMTISAASHRSSHRSSTMIVVAIPAASK